MSEKPSQSIRKGSQIVKILCSLTRLVLKNDLGLKPYKKPDLHEIWRQMIIRTHMDIILMINKTILVLKNCCSFFLSKNISLLKRQFILDLL